MKFNSISFCTAINKVRIIIVSLKIKYNLITMKLFLSNLVWLERKCLTAIWVYWGDILLSPSDIEFN